MSNFCRQCLKSISRGGYQIGGRGALCRYCATRATGMTTSALTAAFGARIKAQNSKRLIKRLREQIAKNDEIRASMQERIDFLEDEIASMLDDPNIYEREMAKHERK